jgi:hypothetical protein
MCYAHPRGIRRPSSILKKRQLPPTEPATTLPRLFQFVIASAVFSFIFALQTLSTPLLRASITPSPGRPILSLGHIEFHLDHSPAEWLQLT